MNSEATLLIEAIRTALLLATAFGFAISDEQQVAILAFAGAAISLGLAFLNRAKVFAQDTTEELVANAAATGNPTLGPPPSGEPQ